MREVEKGNIGNRTSRFVGGLPHTARQELSLSGTPLPRSAGMGNPGKSHSSLDPLRKTIESLSEIRSSLDPFLRLLRDDDAGGARRRHLDADGTGDPAAKRKRGRPSDDDESGRPLTPHARAEAEAAVALAMGTLRYMGARLRGQDRGRKPGDPLRAELDKIRGILVALRKLEKEGEEDAANEGSSKAKDGKDSSAGMKGVADPKENVRGNSEKKQAKEAEIPNAVRLNKKQRR